MKQKLKWFKEAGVLQHIACFLLYVFTGAGAMLLWELLEDSETLFVLSSTALCVPVIVWAFYLGYCDVTRIGKWLWKRIVPQKWWKKTVQPKTMAVKKPDVSKTETEIFRMWDDAVVWKDGKLQLRKNGEYTPITLEQAREQERGYHRYQMSMDVNRGGLPDEVAQQARGFDQNGNYVGKYAVDAFFEKKFGIDPNSAVDREERKCARCGKIVNQDEVIVREGSAYCVGCANRLQIKLKKADEAKKKEVLKKVKEEIRCEHCGKLLKAGEVVSRRGAPYCRKCGDLPEKSMDGMVLDTGEWSIVWNNGKLYKHTQKGGYVRISLDEARKMEREYWWGHVYIAVDRFFISQEEAESRYGFKDGKYAVSYAVDALKDGRKGTEVFSTILDSVIWMNGGLYILKYSGEYSPISVEDARKLEYDFWNHRAAQAYRAAEVELYEEYQSRIDEVARGMKRYSVDEFMSRESEAVCIRCGARHKASLETLAAPDFACKTCGSPVKIKDFSRDV